MKAGDDHGYLILVQDDDMPQDFYGFLEESKTGSGGTTVPEFRISVLISVVLATQRLGDLQLGEDTAPKPGLQATWCSMGKLKYLL